MLCSLSSEAAVNNMISNADLQVKMHFYLCLQDEKKPTKQKQTMMHVLTVYGLLRVEFNFGQGFFFLPIHSLTKSQKNKSL